ncbi:GGDEF domain-containing protein [Desulfobacter hydrogenophilus]|uniref:diguanylate cyclase n=1 Tax=Desulfobacter hydrogenophilus TaxID=2291 RepID=A0A328FJU5_9BACT|nr:GGDEF domain-containing protein [Desulfobacter hydrogenophilus]NDY73206.1 GGDEF domain-containing protein [Desulfobacter hydrogenophilus]QBH12522.1 GGDEF domain-containing protein [Desulfobacter hydrogenophilus]RAM03257.1 GGDEF domain-containing protein [Desulfobacter hydrogenophilus]
MNRTLDRFSHRLSVVFGLVFGYSLNKTHAQNKLARHIVVLNGKTSPSEIINEVADCLKGILGYRLFAFVNKKNAGMDVWLDPRMYKTSIEDIIIKDFQIKDSKDLTYLNIHKDQEECLEKFSLDSLVHYDHKEENCYSRLYMMPSRPITAFHDDVVRIVLQGCSSALSRQIKIQHLKDAAAIDPLTGCYNRGAFEAQLKGHAASAGRHKKPLSVFMFDLDHFKSVNDTYGHLGGDEVLKEVSRLVRRNIRTEDIFARYGGEEFIAILPETDQTHAIELADRLRQKICALRIPFNNRTIRVTGSFGVAQLGTNADIVKLVEDADSMLYKAKFNGRNTVMPGLIRVHRDETSESLIQA